MGETDGEHRRRRVRGNRPGRLSRGSAAGDVGTEAPPGPDLASDAGPAASGVGAAAMTGHGSSPSELAAANLSTAPDAGGRANAGGAHVMNDAPVPRGTPTAADTPAAEAPDAGARSGPVPAPSRMARFGAKRSAERPRPEPRPWSRGADRSAASGSAASDRAGRTDRPDVADRAAADRGLADRATSADREPFDSHAPGPTDDHERGLRGLIGGGSSQVSVTAAMRARDASRPTDADIANAEQTLAIVHRGWVPRE